MLRPVALTAAVLLALPAPAFETVRIAMGPVDDRVLIQGQGLAYGSDADDARLTAAPSGALVVRNVKGRLYLDGAPWLGESVRFRAGEDLRDAGVPGPEPIKAGSLEVRGDLVVRARGGRLVVINVVSLEDYLAAVLGSEMPRSFPDEALKAQAVAARTYALHKKLQAYGEDFHLGASVLHQVYGGLAREDARTRAAVEATRGQVLTYDLAPIEAYFHASCGGKTESGLQALGRPLPYLRPVACGCGALASSHWNLTLPREELATLFPGASGLTPDGLTATGRVRRVQLGGVETDAVRFRAKVGYSRVRSLAFEVVSSDQRAFHLRGRGSGHGAGMCQWGAKLYADQGWDYLQILSHYYPGTELQTLY
ncbi:MAG: SpoIID/LytB domain-containing protein [Myxococcota bacterium]|nr:SpoIID/LytB domain-containing protein [Myxococcota bacterium]